MTTRALVTGANGLVGRAVVNALARAGVAVQAMVRTVPTRPFPDSVETVVHDLTRDAAPPVDRMPDKILHLAQSNHHRDFPGGAHDVFAVNLAATQRLLDWAASSGVQSFTLASSGGIYRPGAAETFKETDMLAPPGALNHYLATKQATELIAKPYAAHMIVSILRFFFVYGPGQRKEMLIPRLIERVRRDEPIDLHGPDGLSLNPIYVDDAARATVAAAASPTGITLNIAGVETLTLRQIGGYIGDAVGHTPLFVRKSDALPPAIHGDIDTMKKLGVVPEFNFVSGIKNMIYFK